MRLSLEETRGESEDGVRSDLNIVIYNPPASPLDAEDRKVTGRYPGTIK